MSSPVWSKNSSAWSTPRFTRVATISQYEMVMRNQRSSSLWDRYRGADLVPAGGLELRQEPLARAAQLGLAAQLVEPEQQFGIGRRGLAHGLSRKGSVWPVSPGTLAGRSRVWEGGVGVAAAGFAPATR